MFVKLTAEPRLPVEAEFAPTLFGDTVIRVWTTTVKGRERKDYRVESLPRDMLLYAAIDLVHGDKTHRVSVLETGEACCTCEAFYFEKNGQTGRHCKHTWTAMTLELLPIKPLEKDHDDPRPVAAEVC